MALTTMRMVDGPLDKGGCGTHQATISRSLAAPRKDLSSTFNWPLTKTVKQTLQSKSRKVLHKNTYRHFPIPFFQHPEDHELQTSCGPCSWGDKEDTFYSAQTLLSKQHLAKTYTSNSSKEVTEAQSHHHSYLFCWCTYFYIHSPKIYCNTMGTDSLHHPELCNEEAACLGHNFISTFLQPEISDCWEHTGWSLTAPGLEPGTKKEDDNALGNKHLPLRLPAESGRSAAMGLLSTAQGTNSHYYTGGAFAKGPYAGTLIIA